MSDGGGGGRCGGADVGGADGDRKSDLGESLQGCVCT